METFRTSGWLILTFVSITSGFPLRFDPLPPLLFVLILLVLFVLLIRWGPEMVAVNRPTRWASMLGLATIVTALLNSAVLENNIYGSFVLWLSILLVLIVFVTVSKSSPIGKGGSRLQTITIAILIVLGLTATLGNHFAQDETSTGAYWVLDIPFAAFIRIPRPYDYYLIRIGPPIVALTALVCGMGLALIYFVVNRRASEPARTA